MIRRFLMVLAIAVGAIGVCADESLGQTLYGITFSSNQLITINPATGAGTLVGAVPAPTRPFGLGFRGAQLYTYSENAPRNIRELDPATGAVLNTINIGSPAVNEGDLVFRSDGIGFITQAGIFGGYQLYSFDITVPSSTPVGPNLPTPIDGLAFDGAGTLYALDQDGTKLYTLDTTTGVLTLVGNTGIAATVFGLGGLAFDSTGKLYATACSGGSPSNLYSVNTATGAATLIGPIGFNEVSGLRFSIAVPPPVPVPKGVSKGTDEGSYPRSSGPPTSPFGAGEGGFGFGNLRAQGALSPGASPRSALLFGPVVHPADRSLRVYNVSNRQPTILTEPSADNGGATSLGWPLFAGLMVGAVALVITQTRR